MRFKPLRTTLPPYTLAGGMPYTPAAATDLRELFARIRAEQEAARAERERRNEPEQYGEPQ